MHDDDLVASRWGWEDEEAAMRLEVTGNEPLDELLGSLIEVTRRLYAMDRHQPSEWMGDLQAADKALWARYDDYAAEVQLRPGVSDEDQMTAFEVSVAERLRVIHDVFVSEIHVEEWHGYEPDDEDVEWVLPVYITATVDPKSGSRQELSDAVLDLGSGLWDEQVAFAVDQLLNG